MTTLYPGGTDSFTNPAASDSQATVSHSSQHANINDAMEAVQAVLGTTAGTAVLKNFTAGEFAEAESQLSFGTNKYNLGTGALSQGVALTYNGTSVVGSASSRFAGTGEEDNVGGGTTASSTFGNIPGADVIVAITAGTANVWLNAYVTAYGNNAGAPYVLTWHNGTSTIGPTTTTYLAASNLRTNIGIQTMVLAQTIGTTTYTLQQKSSDNSSTLTAEAINMLSVPIGI